jgi:hypothetical protein
VAWKLESDEKTSAAVGGNLGEQIVNSDYPSERVEIVFVTFILVDEEEPFGRSFAGCFESTMNMGLDLRDRLFRSRSV